MAELGSAFVCADLDLAPEARADHAAYIASWIKVLKNDRRAIFTAASHAATYFDSSGVMRIAPQRTPRLDHNPSASPYPPKGVLIEESRTNSILYSEQMEQWSTTGTITFATDNRTAPNGISTADDVIFGTTGSENFFQTSPSTFTAGSTFTGSFYFKYISGSSTWYRVIVASSSEANGGNFWFNAQACSLGSSSVRGTGTVVASSATLLASGWCRVTGTATVGASDTTGVLGFLPADADNSTSRTLGGVISAWGAQLEVETFPTSYIPTSGSTVTRAQDSFSIPVGTWFNATTGTFITDTYGNINNDSGGQNGNSRVVAGDTPLDFLGFNISNFNQVTTYHGTSTTVTAPVTASTKTPIRMAMAWDQNATTRSISGGGSAIATNTSYSGNYSTTKVWIGAMQNGWTLNAGVRRVTFMPTRQPDTSLPDYSR